MNTVIQEQIDALDNKTRMAISVRALTFYKEEKACYTDPVTDEVDEAFTKYPVWLEAFWEDFFANRRLVSLEEAEAISDAEVAEAEAVLDGTTDVPIVPIEVQATMTTPDTKVSVQPTKEVKQMSKTVKTKKAVVKSKADVARSIVTKLVAKGKARKDVIEALVTQASMSPAYASTFYQSHRAA